MLWTLVQFAQDSMHWKNDAHSAYQYLVWPPAWRYYESLILALNCISNISHKASLYYFDVLKYWRINR